MQSAIPGSLPERDMPAGSSATTAAGNGATCALRRVRRTVFTSAAALLIFSCASFAADRPENWTEVRSPHFIVITNGNEKQARRIAEQFEHIRAVFKSRLKKSRVDSGKPMFIFAVKDEKALKTLLPAYFEKKGATRVAGMFIPGQEKSYVALRLDYEGENPFHVVYHEYVHSLLRLNLDRIPLWVDEGLAEFYANTTIGGKEVLLGRANEDDLRVLQQNKLVPLEQLFKVDHSSPLYNQQNKATIFYAESWALAHYLQLDPEIRKVALFTNYLERVLQGADELDAARQAFGDLKQLEKKLESYVRQSSYYAVPLPTPKDLQDLTFQSRPIPPAESAARRGDFYLHTGRTQEARGMLEEALRLDPELALAHESLGFLHFRENDRAAAAKSFARAVELDSHSFLAHYYHALMTVQSSPGEGMLESMESVEGHLHRAIELQPDFAPAYSALATFYLAQDKKLDEALPLARKAAELEPGVLVHHLNIAGILLSLENVDEALRLGQRVRNSAKTPQDIAMADSFLEHAHRQQQYLAERKRYEEELKANAAAREKERKAVEELEKNQAAKAAQADAAAPPVETAAKSKSSRRIKTTGFSAVPSPSSPVPAGQTVAAEGRIAASTCSGLELNLTLDFGGLTLELRAAKYAEVEYLTTTWSPPANFNPCLHLRGHSAEIKYQSVQGKSYAGEILSVEVRR